MKAHEQMAVKQYGIPDSCNRVNEGKSMQAEGTCQIANTTKELTLLFLKGWKGPEILRS